MSHISVLNRIPMSRRCYQKTFLLCGRRFVRNSKSFGKGNKSEYALKGEDCLSLFCGVEFMFIVYEELDKLNWF